MHERCRVVIGEQIYSNHNYEFAVISSQFRFITINLVARDARAHYHTLGRQQLRFLELLWRDNKIVRHYTL